MRQKVLFSITTQFGYHTDTYMYCKYLDKSKYEVYYVGFDSGYTVRELENVNVFNVAVSKNKIKRYLDFLLTINRLIRNEKVDIVFLVSCQTTLLVRLCNLFQKSILDIRTGDVRIKEHAISWYDTKVLITSLFFKRITIISKSLGRKMYLPEKKCHWLPLGGDFNVLPTKSFETICLFYIGTLTERNLDQTVEGLALFKKRNSVINIEYNIVGSGTVDDEKRLLSTIRNEGLSDIVIFHGRKNHEEAKDLFEKSNLGVVYIPITPGYTCQPTTKLYEYLLAGMPVIATRTLENKHAMSLDAGVLIDDNAESFANGLEEVLNKINIFDSEKIKSLYLDSSWENIVKNNLEPYLHSAIINR